MLAFLVWFGVAAAQDQEPPEESVPPERPLAIPLTRQAPRPLPEPARDEESEAEKVSALRSYRNQFMAVRHYSGLAMGTTTVHTDWYGGYGWGWGTVRTGVPYYYRVDGWGVFVGPQRLETLSYLDHIGDLNTQQIVKQKTRSQRTLGAALYGLGAAGVVGSIVSSAGARGAQTQAEFTQWRWAGTASVGVILGGFIGGSFPMSKARRLLTHPGQSVDLATIEEQVADYNDALRAKLDLSPTEALSVENQQSR